MEAAYIGDPSANGEGLDVMTYLGTDFPKGEFVPVTTVQATKLAGNSHFQVRGEPEAVPLSDLTVPQLKALAEERGVDLTDVTKKADIIAALELAAEVEGGEA